MAGLIGNGVANELLDYALGAGTWGGTVKIALFTVAPSGSGGGTEVSGGGYARISVTDDSTTFPAASGRTKTNGIDFDFGTFSAAVGTVVWAAAVKPGAGGTLGADDIIAAGPLTNPRALFAGDKFKIFSGGQQFTA